MPKANRFSFDVFTEAATAPITQTETTDEVTVHGVSVMTEGPAVSHFIEIPGNDGKKQRFQVFVDRTTLEQIMTAAKKFANGVKSKADHEGGIKDVIGRFANFAIGQTQAGLAQLKGDFSIFKSSAFRDHALNLLKTIPDAIGFSALFDGPVEKIGERYFARCDDLMSIDFVPDPAANPSGAFSKSATPVDTPPSDEQPPTSEQNMTPEDIQNACAKALEPHIAKVNEMSTKLASMAADHDAIKKHLKMDGPATPPDEDLAPAPADEEGMYKKFSQRFAKEHETATAKAIETGVAAEIQKTMTTLHALGLRPGQGPLASAPSDRPAKDPKDMSFEELCTFEMSKPENAKTLKEKGGAYSIIRTVAMANPAKHRSAMSRRDADGALVGIREIVVPKIAA